MNRFAKIIISFFTTLILISGCNNNYQSSPFAAILNNPPYDVLSDSIQKEPGKAALYFRRAILLNTNNLAEPALADFKKAWSLEKEEPYAFGISTILLNKNPDSAIVFLQDAIKVLPNSFLLRLNLARSLSAQNKFEEALHISNDILKQNPEQVDILKMKADLLFKKGNFEEAIVQLEKAYSLTPFDVELNYFLALKYAETKNQKLLPLTDSLIKADSLDIHAEPYYYKGIYYSSMNDKIKALHYFDLAIKHDYNFLDGYIEKGAILYEMKKYQEAFGVFNLALTISPKFADAWYWIAKCQEAQGKNEEAKLNYLRAYSLDKNLVEAKEAADKMK